MEAMKIFSFFKEVGRSEVRIGAGIAEVMR